MPLFLLGLMILTLYEVVGDGCLVMVCPAPDLEVKCLTACVLSMLDPTLAFYTACTPITGVEEGAVGNCDCTVTLQLSLRTTEPCMHGACSAWQLVTAKWWLVREPPMQITHTHTHTQKQNLEVQTVFSISLCNPQVAYIHVAWTSYYWCSYLVSSPERHSSGCVYI